MMKQNEELLYNHTFSAVLQKNMIMKSVSVPFKIRQTTIFRYETRLIIQESGLAFRHQFGKKKKKKKKKTFKKNSSGPFFFLLNI